MPTEREIEAVRRQSIKIPPIIIIGGHRDCRKGKIKQLIRNTALPSRFYINVGLDCQKIRGLRNGYYVDCGMRDDYSSVEIEKYMLLRDLLKAQNFKQFAELTPPSINNQESE